MTGARAARTRCQHLHAMLICSFLTPRALRFVASSHPRSRHHAPHSSSLKVVAGPVPERSHWDSAKHAERYRMAASVGQQPPYRRRRRPTSMQHAV